MPRAIDVKQPEGLYDPTRSGTEFHLGSFQQIDQLIAQILEGAIESFKTFIIPAIEELTGLDLSAVVAVLDELDIDFTSPEGFLTSLVHAIILLPEILVALLTSLLEQLVQPGNSDMLEGLLSALIGLLAELPSLLVELANSLINSAAGLLGFNSPLNALNLFNIIPTNILGQLNFSNIGETFANLITDPLFQVVEAFTGLTDWTHFAGLGHAGNGAAQTTANGATHELLGNLIPVSLGQVLNLSAWTKWTGLLGTGSPIALAVTGYNDAGTAVNQTSVAAHNTTPTTTDWLNLTGTYTVPAGVTGVRTRLSVGSTATAGTVWWDDISANKTQSVFQRLIAGTDPGTLLPDDISNLFTGIVSNAVGLLDRVLQGDFDDLLGTLGGSFGDTLSDVEDRLNDFLHSLSPLNGSNIATGNIGDAFIPGIGSILTNIVTGLAGVSGTGFSYDDMFSVLLGNKHALTDHGAGIIDMYARMSNLESQFAALPVSAGGTGSGNADGGLIGAIDTDTFERTSSTNLGSLWSQTQTGAGIWATPNGHDATWNPSGSANAEFLCIRNNPDILRSQTDYQRVTMELSSTATRYYDSILGLFNYTGANYIWLRVSDATTSLANITGVRIGWKGDGSLSIVKFVTGTPTATLASLGVGGIVPPGPGAQLIGEAGVLNDGAKFFFRAKIGESIRLSATDATVATGATNRRWGHGGRAEGAGTLGQMVPGGVHFWNGMDQTTT